ncbi:MAG TPA: twin-arginine translocase TatA/TatE family subunit [Nitrospirota bacterium]
MFNFFQPLHLLMLFIVLLIFGPLMLPELGAGLVKGIRELKKAMTSYRMVAVEEQKEDEES